MSTRVLCSSRGLARLSGVRYSERKSNYEFEGTLEKTKKYIDMRSDTVTQPSDRMRLAMMNAQVGDDVFGEDPTIAALEERCARMFQKESALFVASGTMGNLISIMAHCQRGDEIIVGRHNHIHKWEQGNYAQLAGVSATTLNVAKDGTMCLTEIEESIRYSDPHCPISKLICLETTHNFCGGIPISLKYLSDVRQLASRYDIRVHIDGARIYNAAVALGVTVAEISKFADSVMMCFSKGLGAPVGSIIVGSRDFITEAKRRRKALGGGWRQAGVLASAAMVSLDEAMSTVINDHQNTQFLARSINVKTPESLKSSMFVETDNLTNMVVVNCINGVCPQKMAEYFKKNGILVMAFDEKRVRIIPNWNITKEDLRKTVAVYESFAQMLLRLLR